MRHIVSIYVHQKEKYSYSSNDFIGYKVFTSTKTVLNFIRGNGYSLNKLDKDNETGITLYYLTDITYNNRRKYIEEIFEQGNFPEYDNYYSNRNKLYYEKRRRNGFVSYKPNEDMTIEDYKGALKNSISKELSEYISSSIVAGYIGHSGRKYVHDIFIEETLENISVTLDSSEIDKWQIFSIWLSSTDARHFMDYTADEDIEYFKKEFSKSLKYILIKGYIYSLNEHNGSYSSSEKLYSEYEDRINFKYNK